MKRLLWFASRMFVAIYFGAWMMCLCIVAAWKTVREWREDHE